MGQIIGLLLIAAVLWIGYMVATVRTRVPIGSVGLRYRNGRYDKTLDPGTYRWFDPLRRSELAKIDITEQVLGNWQIDVISADKFAFRITLAVIGKISDPRAYREAGGSNASIFTDLAFSRLQPTLAHSAMQAVGEVELEQFITDSAPTLGKIEATLAPPFPGGDCTGLLLTAINLPPETRKMFTEVERSRRAGLAALERARSEQASLRALANAARNLKDNPELAKLRMLQLVEQTGGPKTFVLGEIEPAAIPGSTKK